MAFNFLTNAVQRKMPGENTTEKLLHPSVEAAAVFAAINIAFSVTASLGNVIILLALHKVTSIHSPTKVLLQCLVVTDLCVGLISQPLYATSLVNAGIANFDMNIFRYVTRIILPMSALVLCGVSLATSAAISVDRLLALFLGLNYRYVATLRRVRGVLVCIWFINGTLAVCAFISHISIHLYNLCQLISLVISVFSYTNIYIRLRHKLQNVQNHPPEQIPASNSLASTAINVARYKKTVSTIAWVQLGLISCYLPICVASFLQYRGKFRQIPFIHSFLSLLYFNSSLNPILFCWKIREVKQAVKAIIRNLNCSCRTN